jgi:hypothetical protein
MSLVGFEGKNVKIIDIDGKEFEGYVSDYVHPGDDDTGLESIIIDCTKGSLTGEGVEFWAKDIKSIEVIS